MKGEDERKLIEMVAEGYTDREIAETLCYSISWVKQCRVMRGLMKGRGKKPNRERGMQEKDR